MRRGFGTVPKSSSVNFVPKPTIAFDLDETLISATPIRPNDGDYFAVRVNRRPVFVRLRPGLINFLNRVQKGYNVFFFSSSQREYGDQVIDRIAPNVRSCRRFFRDSCVSASGYSIKDLRVLRTNLKQTLLVDDIAGSALHNPNNLIRIKPWYGERDDDVLESELLPLLERILYENDLAKSASEIINTNKYAQLSGFHTRSAL